MEHKGLRPLINPGVFRHPETPEWMSFVLAFHAYSDTKRKIKRQPGNIGCKMSKVLYCAMSVMIISPFSTVTRLIWIASWL